MAVEMNGLQNVVTACRTNGLRRLIYVTLGVATHAASEWLRERWRAEQQALEHSGFLARLLTGDVPASSALTRDLLGWQPTHPGLIDDLKQGHCFRVPS